MGKKNVQKYFCIENISFSLFVIVVGRELLAALFEEHLSNQPYQVKK